MEKEIAKKIISKAKEEYKEHCKNQFFCDRCKYATEDNDRVNCFEKFYINNFNSITSQLKL